MSSLETVLICESTWETPTKQGALPASKILDVVGIQQPGSPTLWTYGMKPTGHEEESPLDLPAEQAARLAAYFEQYFATKSLRYGQRNCLGFAAFMQDWINTGNIWASKEMNLSARQVPMNKSVAGAPYAFYGSRAAFSEQGMQHAVVGTGVTGDCIGVDSAGGSLLRKPVVFIALERSSDTYCEINRSHR